MSVIDQVLGVFRKKAHSLRHLGEQNMTETLGRTPWRATHQHKKGGHYRVLGQGILEADRSDVVLYDDKEGTIWVRARSEFYDGRFVEIEFD